MSESNNWVKDPRYPDLEGKSFPGMILKGVGGIYTIELSDGRKIFAKPRGIFRKHNLTPTPGDDVKCTLTGDDQIPARIDRIEERGNLLIRPPIANIDILYLTFSVQDPDPDFLLLDKLLIACGALRIKPTILITKADLDRPGAKRLASCYAKSGFATNVSAKDQSDELDRQIKDQCGRHLTIAFAGPSGTGKSTVVNRLMGEKVMETGSLSEKLGRGRHTTRHVELIPCAGGYLTDTPGFTSLELADMGIEPEEVILGYPEFENLVEGCRFNTCRHLDEPGCAVRTFVERPELESDSNEPGACEFEQHLADRLDRYQLFRKQLDDIPIYLRKKRR